jgi:hypothetical protein
MKTMHTVAILVCVVVAAGCGGSIKSEGDTTADTSTPPDAADTTADSAADPGPDTAEDAAPDIVVDPGPDPVDAVPDTAVDTRPEVPPDGIVGDPCSTSGDCSGVPGSGRMCLTDVFGMMTMPGGYCSADCTSDSDCGSLGDCVDFFGYGSYCLRTCSSPPDCRTSEGYTCDMVPGISSGPYCLPPLGGPDGGPPDY